MRILLVNPPWMLSKSSVYSKTGALYPPLGLAYISAYVEKHCSGVEVDLMDARSLGYSLEEFGKHLDKQHYDIIGFITYTTTSRDALKAAQLCKKKFPSSIIVMGGPHATLLPEDLLQFDYVDIVVRGEGEETFTEIVESLKKGSSLNKVRGISYKDADRVVHNDNRPLLPDLNDLPRPSRDKLPMEIYRPASGAYKRLPVTSIITSRGCPFKCAFCSKAIYGNSVRALSPENILLEINELIERYRVKELYFCDDSFSLNRQRTVEICEGIINQGLDITWTCSTRVNLVDQELLMLMKKAGCVSIGYGVESGDENISKQIDKGISFNQVRDAINWTRKAGIESRTSYIFGFPGENWESIQKTLNFAKELNSDFVIFNLAIPLPGTKIYDMAKDTGSLIYDNEELYTRCDGAHPLIKLDGITSNELIDFYKNAYRNYYLRPKYILNRIKSIRTPHDLLLNFKGLMEFFAWSKSLD